MVGAIVDVSVVVPSDTEDTTDAEESVLRNERAKKERDSFVEGDMADSPE